MSIKGRDKEFRTPKTTYLDFKHIEMDRVLTMLFPRLKYDGYASRRPPRGGELTIEEFLDDFLEHPEWFEGFDKHPQVVRRWIETDLMDVIETGARPIRPSLRRDLYTAIPTNSAMLGTLAITVLRSKSIRCCFTPEKARVRQPGML